MHWLTFLKVTVVFIAVVYAMKKKVPMGLALSGGGLAIALLMGFGPRWILDQLAGGDAILFSTHTCEFVAVMGLTVSLSFVLERSRQIERLTNAFRTSFSNPRVTLATLPAIIGLLPMPGGALFSAPMVEAAATGTGLDGEEKALINYWYRHVWEYAWPLYPGIIYSAQLMHREMREVALAQFPLCIVAIVGGFLFLRRATAPPVPRESAPRRQAALDIFIALLPFAIITVTHLVAKLNIVASVGLGFGVASLWLLGTRAIGFRTLLKTVFANWGVLEMMLMGYGAKIFGDLMMRAGAIDGISALLQSMNLPVILLAIALPYAVGFFAGMTIVYVMTALPVLLTFPEVSANPLPFFVLAFAAGYCGTLMSPIHACLVLSAKYFKSDLLRPIYRMALPCLALVLTGLALFFVYRRFPITLS